jgi:hypothetical protein
MIDGKKTPLDLMGDIYSLAYWMTGSEKSANDLLNRVYLNIDIESSEMEVIKMFRICYFDSIGVELSSDITNNMCLPEDGLTESLWKWFDDIKLSVLMPRYINLFPEMRGSLVMSQTWWMSLTGNLKTE